jgi:hypothetical protein
MGPTKLLGRSTLINQRTGGKFNSYQPSDQDAALFQMLRTSVFQEINRMKESGQLQAFGPETHAHEKEGQGVRGREVLP